MSDAFANECEGVDADQPGGRMVLPQASSGSTFDSPAPSAQELSFYQFECCCDQSFYLAKTPVPNPTDLQVVFF